MKLKLNKCWKIVMGAASCLLATSVIPPLTAKQLQNKEQNLNNQNQILVDTPSTTNRSHNVNTLSEVTNDTIGAQVLFDNTNIPNVTINYTSTSSAVTITSAAGPIDASGYDLTMINSIGGVSITTISLDAFNVNYSRQISCNSLTLPSGLTSIGNLAFYGCSGLTGITLPSGLISIGFYAFQGCSLDRIGYPNEETSGSGMTTKTWGIGGTTWLARSFWDSNNQLIGRMIEKEDTAYTQVGCLVIGEIDMSTSGLISVGSRAFFGCSGLTGITLPSGLTSIGTHAFNGCSGLTSITLPSGLESIGDDAFADCSDIATISLPSSVTSIGQEVFGMSNGVTSKLQSITFNWTNPASMACIDNNWLMGESDYNPVATFYVPKDSLDEYNAYVTDLETCPAWWNTGSVKHFEAIPEPGPTSNNDLGLILGLSLGLGIPVLAGAITGIVVGVKKHQNKGKKK